MLPVRFITVSKLGNNIIRTKRLKTKKLQSAYAIAVMPMLFTVQISFAEKFHSYPKKRSLHAGKNISHIVKIMSDVGKITSDIIQTTSDIVFARFQVLFLFLIKQWHTTKYKPCKTRWKNRVAASLHAVRE